MLPGFLRPESFSPLESDNSNTEKLPIVGVFREVFEGRLEDLELEPGLATEALNNMLGAQRTHDDMAVELGIGAVGIEPVIGSSIAEKSQDIGKIVGASIAAEGQQVTDEEIILLSALVKELAE